MSRQPTRELLVDRLLTLRQRAALAVLLTENPALPIKHIAAALGVTVMALRAWRLKHGLPRREQGGTMARPDRATVAELVKATLAAS